MSVRTIDRIIYVSNLENDEKTMIDWLKRFTESVKTHPGLKRLHEPLCKVLDRIESGDPPPREADQEMDNPKTELKLFKKSYEKWLKKMGTPEVALKMVINDVAAYGSSLKYQLCGLPPNINPFRPEPESQVAEDECIKLFEDHLNSLDVLMETVYEDGEWSRGWMMKADVEEMLEGLGIDELDEEMANDKRKALKMVRKNATEAEWVINGMRVALAEVSPDFRLRQEKKRRQRMGPLRYSVQKWLRLLEKLKK